VLGQANCILSPGDIEVASGTQKKARDGYRIALRLYERIAEPYSIGWAHVRLAQIAPYSATRHQQVLAVAQAWTQAKRDDLPATLRAEFPDDALGS
jgi:hypothetical protein